MDAPVLRDKNTDTDDLCDDQRLYYANDANMNVTALLATDGTPLERYVYDPYGKVTIYDDDWSETRNTSSYDNSILFCGYYHDWETGLYHVRNRVYHPHLGAWLNRDPAGYSDGMSLYEYCASGPLGALDAMGLSLIEPGDPGWDPQQSPSLPSDWWITQPPGPNTSKPCPTAKKPDEPPDREKPLVPPVEPPFIISDPPEVFDPSLRPGPGGVVRRKSGIVIGVQGTPGDLPSLPPGHDPGSWPWKPAQNYDPIKKPEMRPGNFTDPEGNRWQWDPDTSGKHGYRPHWDKDPADGGPRERYLPDGTRLLVERAVEVTTIAVTLKVIWEGIRAIGPFLDRAAGRACPIFIISPMPLEYYAPKPKQPNYFGEKEQPIQG